jgi:hypothetical protein
MSMLGGAWIIEEMAANAPDRGAVLDDIRVLTAAPAPLLAQVERTLADGYACALQIEAERRRLRQRLEERAASLDESPGSERVVEVAGLAQGIERSNDELTELRGALLELRETARRLRAA